MSHAIVDVWKLLWPNGINTSDYEAAYKMAELVTAVQNTSVEPTEFKPHIVEQTDFLTTQEAAKTLGLTKESVYAIVRSGKISATHKGKDPRSGLLISRSSLAQYKKSRTA